MTLSYYCNDGATPQGIGPPSDVGANLFFYDYFPTDDPMNPFTYYVGDTDYDDTEFMSITVCVYLAPDYSDGVPDYRLYYGPSGFQIGQVFNPLVQIVITQVPPFTTLNNRFY